MFLGWQFWIPSQVWMWWSAWRQKPSTTWLFRAMTKLNNIHFFFCLPPGSQYKFDLSKKHKIKLEWPYYTSHSTATCPDPTLSRRKGLLCLKPQYAILNWACGSVEALLQSWIFFAICSYSYFSSTVRFWDEVLGLGNGLIQVALRYLTQNWHNIPKHVTFSRWAWKVNVYKQCLNSGSQRLWGLVS